MLLFAERHLEGGVSAFAGQAAALPGTEAERQASTSGLDHTEVFPLMLFAVGGMMMFPASNDLLTMFVALEVLSLPLYLLCGLARRRRLLSQEAALKYFLLGAFSSGFFLYGVALVYGYAGSFELAAINEAVRNDLGNRDAAARRHGHAGGRPAVQGRRRAVPRLDARRLPGRADRRSPRSWPPAPRWPRSVRCCASSTSASAPTAGPGSRCCGSIAILTMVVGAVLAIAQTDVKRMLAYSSIAHTGFLLTGVLGVQSATELADGQLTSLQAVLFYLVTYGFATMGAFAVVTLVRDAGGEQTHLSRWAGLGKESPLVAGVFAFFLLGDGGHPADLRLHRQVGRVRAALSAGAWPGRGRSAILSSIVAAFFYVRVIVLMYFTEPAVTARRVTSPSILTAVDHRRRRGRHAGAGRRSRPGARPGGAVRENSSGDPTPAPAGLALPVTDAALADAASRAADAGRGGRARRPRREPRRASSPRPPRTCSHAGGKRFRPLLVLLAAEVGDRPDSDDVIDARPAWSSSPTSPRSTTTT